MMDIPLPPELMDPDLSNTSDGTGAATVSSVGLYANGRYSGLASASPTANGPVASNSTAQSESNASLASETSEKKVHSSSEAETDGETLNSSSSTLTASVAAQTNKDPDANKSLELRKLWKPVRANASDFTAWTTLLTFVEQQESIGHIREAYDGFFGRYPYCYGYWKKYSELEKRFGSLDQSETVLEQGVAAVPLSIDLWMYYIAFARERYKGVAGEGRIRQLFGRAIEAAGLDFKSDDLWDAYIQWEKALGQVRNVFSIYERLIRVPTLYYARHFEELSQLIVATSTRDLLAPEELQSMKAGVVEGDDMETGLKQLVIQSRQQVHKNTELETGKRWNFEQNIRRPYFHVKPLEASQIKNWSDYLAFEIDEKQISRIIFLFERCLVACALYEEFWKKYLDYLRDNDQMDYMRYAYQRVCSFHLPNKVALHLEWAAFEEEQGNMDGAVLALQNGLKHLPNRPLLALRHLGVVRRMQASPDDHNNEVENCFDHYVAGAEAQDVGLAEFFLIKQARYHLKLRKDKERAVQIIRSGLKRDPTSSALLTALIDCELQQVPMNYEAVMGVLDEILAKEELGAEQKLLFLEQKIHFLEDFGGDIKQIQAAHRYYYQLTGQVTQRAGAIRKRLFGSEDENEDLADGLPNKMAATSSNHYGAGAVSVSAASWTPVVQTPMPIVSGYPFASSVAALATPTTAMPLPVPLPVQVPLPSQSNALWASAWPSYQST